MGFKNTILNLQLPRNKLVVLTFHQATEHFNPQLHGKYIWSSINHLEKQIIFLKNHFKILRLSDAIDKIQNNEIKNTVVSITFDDGDQSMRDFIVPVFEKHNVPATFFINTAYASGQLKGYWFNIFNYFLNGTPEQQAMTQSLTDSYSAMRNSSNPEEYNKKRKQIEKLSDFIEEEINFYVDLSFLSKLNHDLFELGLHGHEHQRFSMMDENWQKQNLKQNISSLSQLKQYKPIFALPFGKSIDFNAATIKLISELNLQLVLSDNGINRNNDQVINRIPADGRDISSIFKYLNHFAKRHQSR